MRRKGTPPPVIRRIIGLWEKKYDSGQHWPLLRWRLGVIESFQDRRNLLLLYGGFEREDVLVRMVGSASRRSWDDVRE